MPSQMKHQPFVLQMLLIIGGVELNPGPKTRINENADEPSSLEENVGHLSLQHENTSANARTLRLLADCHGQILSLRTQVEQLTKQQQEDRQIVQALQLQVKELKSSLEEVKSHTTTESLPTDTQQPSQSKNKTEKTEDMRFLQQGWSKGQAKRTTIRGAATKKVHKKQLQVNSHNWTSVVNSLAGVWQHKPIAYSQLQQLGTEAQNPLLRACERGYTDLIEVLLDQGMNANTVAYDMYGDTLLHVAAHSGQLPLVRLLLTRGALVEQCEQFGFTPLLTAARAGQLGAVQLLVEHGADVNATTHNGRTSLHWAASSGHTYVVEYLVGRGADTTIRDNIKGDTAENVARAEGYREIANYIAKSCR